MNFANYLLFNKKNLKKKIIVNRELTYQKLCTLINLYSKKFFYQKGIIYGLSLENSENFLVFYLSIIKSGNIVMLIEKGLSSERYEEVIQKYKLNFLITEYDNDYKEFTKEQINIKENISEEKIFFFKRKNFSFIKYKAGTALILLTSGSTGEKKAVMLSHQNLISNTNSILKVLPINKKDIVNLLLPNSYSFGLSIINTHLKKGSSIYVHTSPFVGSLIKELKKYRCSSFYGVPSTFEILLEKTNFLENKFPRLKYIAQAGGHLNKKFKLQILKKFKNKFFIMYGLTEAAPRLSFVPPSKLSKKIESIGIPIPEVKFKLFKYKKNFTQLGVKGKNIMTGYLNEKKMNKYFNQSYFLTGDLAIKDKDGFFYIIKRIDKTSKRFGYKINLPLMERIIEKNHLCKKCKFFLLKNNNLILFIFFNEKKNNTVENQMILKKLLRSKFASYEIPSTIYFLDYFKKSFSKKLNFDEMISKYNLNKN